MKTFEEFETIVNEVVGELPSYVSRWEGKDAFYIDGGKIIQRHLASGAEGGNCWGGEAQYFTNHEKTEEFLPLDPILKLCSPEISYLKYREITSLIKEDSESELEYYGNHRDYNLYIIDIQELYDKIFS